MLQQDKTVLTELLNNSISVSEKFISGSNLDFDSFKSCAAMRSLSLHSCWSFYSAKTEHSQTKSHQHMPRNRCKAI